MEQRPHDAGYRKLLRYRLFSRRFYRMENDCGAVRCVTSFYVMMQTMRNTAPQLIFLNFNSASFRLGIRWSDIMRNEDLSKATNQESAEILLKRRRWTWIGHTLIKPSNSIPRESSDGTLKDKGEEAGARTHGKEELSRRWRRHISHRGQRRQQLKIACNGSNSLVASAPLQKEQRYNSSKPRQVFPSS